LRTRKKVLALAGAAAGIATALPTSVALAESTDAQANDVEISSMRQDIVNWAVQELHDNSHNREVPLGSNCNYYAGVFRTGGTGCANGYRTEAWCADFAKFVWKNGQANIGGLNAATESFQAYGSRHGTWHSGLGGIQPGDAVLYADPQPGRTSHVGIVVSTTGGRIDVVSGNVNNRVYKHDVHYLAAEAIGYVRPVA
jgi:hypothetical protein